jgi:hypothetical protein
MTGPEDGNARAHGARGGKPVHHASPELEAELLQADRDFENGDHLEFTVEELDRCIETGEWPKWPDGSSL